MASSPQTSRRQRLTRSRSEQTAARVPLTLIVTSEAPADDET